MSAMKLSSPQTPAQTNTAASEEPHQTSASLGAIKTQINLHIGGAPDQKDCQSHPREAYLSLMGTVLLPVREGEIWRVQIVWPNGVVHHFGKFASEKDAVDWIAAHSRLTMPAEKSSPPIAPSE